MCASAKCRYGLSSALYYTAIRLGSNIADSVDSGCLIPVTGWDEEGEEGFQFSELVCQRG